MKKAKRMIAAAVVLLVLISGAVTVYAVSADKGEAEALPKSVTAEYAAEEMAVGDYYAAGNGDLMI